MKWAGHVASKGKLRSEYKFKSENLKRRNYLGTFKYRVEDNIKMILKVMGCKRLDLINLVHDWIWYLAIVNTVMKFRVS
jgi:hypothetical protein